MDGLTACQQEKWSSQLGRVPQTPLRQAKNISIIIFVVLASRAAHLLRYSTQPIGGIAAAFRREFAISPQQYRVQFAARRD